MPKVLISDKLSPAAIEIFKSRGVEVDYLPDLGKDKDALFEAISQYDGLAIRSATKVTAKLLSQADNLKVVGRAGIGVDNVEIAAATVKGVIVMNTPFGNSITTAEHAIAMMMACARQIPAADVSTKAGLWEKSKFMGVELTSKTLGLIGCGNIGSIVAERALGLKMKVIAFDPFLTEEKSLELGVTKVDLDGLLAKADFISLHTPLTDQTRNIISAEALFKMKDGVRIINCARGGLVDELALSEALKQGKVAAAAIDVFSKEPARANVLFDAPNIVCTPHLGASTSEAQENVALQIAEQMSDYLISGAISNALNFPSISAEEAPKLTPWVQLAEKLGSFAGQLTENPIKSIRLEFEGSVSELNTKPMMAAAITGLLKPLLQDVNMVSSTVIAKNRGIKIEDVRREKQGIYDGYIRMTIKTELQERSVAGTIFSDGTQRLIQIKNIKMDALFKENMLYITNTDKPGFIGRLGSLLGDLDINIANFSLGREEGAGNAIALLDLDSDVNDDLLKQIASIDGVTQAKGLHF